MDVGVWLRGLGLEQYEALFRENDIDAEVLSDLTDGDGLIKNTLAEAEAHDGELASGLATLDSAIALSERTGQRAWDARERARSEPLARLRRFLKRLGRLAGRRERSRPSRRR